MGQGWLLADGDRAGEAPSIASSPFTLRGEPAVAVTRPLIFEGQLLLLNVDATGGGSCASSCSIAQPTRHSRRRMLASSVP